MLESALGGPRPLACEYHAPLQAAEPLGFDQLYMSHNESAETECAISNFPAYVKGAQRTGAKASPIGTLTWVCYVTR